MASIVQETQPPLGNSFLMCPTRDLSFTESINPWMREDHQPNKEDACAEWAALQRLMEKCGAVIEYIPQGEGCENMPFAANFGLITAPQTIVLAAFRHLIRQKETPLIRAYFEEKGYTILTLGFCFEGQGDALWWGRDLVMNYGFRTEKRATSAMQKILSDREVIPLCLTNPFFYHGDTVFCPISSTIAVWYPDAFSCSSRRRIERYAETHGKELHDVSAEEAVRFVCNSVPIGNQIIMPMPPLGSSLPRWLKKKGFEVITLPFGNHLTSGGAAACLSLRLSPPPL